MHNTFTAFYCAVHDDGFVMAGDHAEMPAAISPCHPGGACVYERHGQFDIRGGIADYCGYRRNYQLIGSDWKFANFARQVCNAQGEAIECPPEVVCAINRQVQDWADADQAVGELKFWWAGNRVVQVPGGVGAGQPPGVPAPGGQAIRFRELDDNKYHIVAGDGKMR
jgi:hypothetical protein